MVNVDIAEQDDRLYVRASLYDGPYSTRDGFTIAFGVYGLLAPGEPEMNA